MVPLWLWVLVLIAIFGTIGFGLWKAKLAELIIMIGFVALVVLGGIVVISVFGLTAPLEYLNRFQLIPKALASVFAYGAGIAISVWTG